MKKKVEEDLLPRGAGAKVECKIKSREEYDSNHQIAFQSTFCLSSAVFPKVWALSETLAIEDL